MASNPRLKNKFYIAIAITIAFINSAALARQGFDIESSFSSNTFNQYLSYRGSKLPYSWNFGFDFTKADARDSSTGVTYTDKSYDVSAGVGYLSFIRSKAGVHLGSTPAEKLTTFGFNLAAGHTFNQRPPRDEDDQDFIPYFYVEGTFATDFYKQSYSISRATRRGSTVNQRGIQLGQYSPGLNFSYSFLEWMSAGGSYQYSFYSRNVGKFLTAIDTTNSLRTISSNLSSALSGFSDHSVQASLTLNPYAPLEFSSKFYFSRDASDKKWTKAMKIGADFDFLESFTVGATYRRDFDLSTGANTYSGSFGTRF